MFHEVYKLCKNDLPIIIFFGILLLFVVAAFILGFIVKEKRENMSPEEKAAEAAQMHHEDLRGIHEPAFVEDYSTSYQQRRLLLKG